MQEHDIINMTYKFAEEYHASDNSGHDFEHIKRVYANVNKLLESEKNANLFAFGILEENDSLWINLRSKFMNDLKAWMT